jgi:hypothetical protein
MTANKTSAAAILIAALVFLVPQLAHATHMPGVGEVLVLLLVVSGLIGLPVAGVTVLVVGLVSRSKGRAKSAGYLVKLGLIVFAAFPVTVLVIALVAAILFG